MSLSLALACSPDGTGDELELLQEDESSDGTRPEGPDTLTADPDAVKRVAGFDVTIAEAGADISLSWGGLGAGFDYDVWRSTSPYFSPGDPGSTMLAGGLLTTAYTDVGGNDTTSYYYRIEASSGANDYQSTLVGKFVQPMVAGGWTLLGFPLLTSATMDASTLAATIPGVTEVNRFFPYVNYDPAATFPNDFAWDQGEAVAINTNATAPTTFTQVGHVPEDTDVDLVLDPHVAPGFEANVVTAPLSMSAMTTTDLFAAEPNLSRIRQWNTATQSFDDIYDTGWSPVGSSPFTIDPGQGVWLYADVDTVWPLCENAPTWGTLLSTGPTTSSAPGGFSTLAPAMAMAEDGSYVIAWTDETDFRVWAQRYGADGLPLAPAAAMSDVGQFVNEGPAVAMAADGTFVVAWTPTNQGTFATYARVFGPDGVATTPTITASPLGTHFVTGTPSVAMADNGDFVVTWTKVGTSPFAPFSQRFAADGTPQGTFFQVSDPSDFVTGDTATAMDENGDFVVAWTSVGVPPFAPFVRVYAADGTPVSGPTQVSDVGTFSTTGAAVDMGADGSFVVGWRDGSDFLIRARTYDATGAATSLPIPVNPVGTFAGEDFDFDGSGGRPSQGVAMFDDGTFAVTYRAFDNGDEDAFLARYASDGTPFMAPENISPVAGQFYAIPRIAAEGCRGDFVVGWPNWQAPFAPQHLLQLSDDDGDGVADQCCAMP